jgi:hypothetical protein
MPTITYQLTSTIIGLLVAGAIIYLVRRDHMHGTYAIWWLGTAVLVVVLGFLPRHVDDLARSLGVNYPPILVVILSIGLILIKMLTMDLDRSRQERKIRRLTQRLAMLEHRLEALEKPADSPATPPSGEDAR